MAYSLLPRELEAALRLFTPEPMPVDRYLMESSVVQTLMRLGLVENANSGTYERPNLRLSKEGRRWRPSVNN